MNYQKGHLEKRIKILISDVILNDLINEDLKNTVITEVELNGDNSIAKVYVDFMILDKKDQERKKQKLLGDLKATETFVRREIAKNLEVKKIPEINFELDELLENINAMDKMIDEVNK